VDPAPPNEQLAQADADVHRLRTRRHRPPPKEDLLGDHDVLAAGVGIDVDGESAPDAPNVDRPGAPTVHDAVDEVCGLRRPRRRLKREVGDRKGQRRDRRHDALLERRRITLGASCADGVRISGRRGVRGEEIGFAIAEGAARGGAAGIPLHPQDPVRMNLRSLACRARVVAVPHP